MASLLPLAQQDLELLRLFGVKRVEARGDGSYVVELFPPSEPAQAATEKLPAATGEERCECACLLSDHEPGGGTCLHGCPAEKCGLPEGE